MGRSLRRRYGGRPSAGGAPESYEIHPHALGWTAALYDGKGRVVNLINVSERGTYADALRTIRKFFPGVTERA